MTYKFKCEDLPNALPYGIEYSDDDEGLEILHVEWYATESERNYVYDLENNV